MMLDLILIGSLAVSLYWNARLYGHREDLAKENSFLLFEMEAARHDVQRFKASALLARFKARSAGTRSDLGVSGDGVDHVPVKSMEE